MKAFILIPVAKFRRYLIILFIMKKNNLKESVGSQHQLRNVLQCSSIRIVFDDQPSNAEIRNTNKSAKDNKVFANKFYQNSMAGFEQSIEMQGYQGNILELMRSKSANTLTPKNQRQPTLKVQKKGTQHLNSLNNTSSFDNMTMKISMNKTNQNNSNLNNLTNTTDQQQARTLKKPQEMQKYNGSYPDNEIKIMISQINKKREKSQDEFLETEQQKKQREEKVQRFIKAQSLLENLKCSNADSELSQHIQESSSFHQPYFKVAKVQSLNQDFQLKQRPKDNEKKPQFTKPSVRITPPMTPRTTNHIKQAALSPKGKKLTLRDYINLNQLSSKIADNNFGSSPNSPLSPLSPRSERKGNSIFKRKKTLTSNSEVFGKIKTEILKDLKLMQDNISILTDFFSSQEVHYEPQNPQIMQIYAVSRMIKQKMLMGNDQIVNYLQGKKGQTP